MSATGIELVTTVSADTPTRCAASAAVVVPAESATAMPGSTRLAARSAIAAFSARWRIDLASKPGSSVEPGLATVAPPCTLSTSPRSASELEVAPDRHVGDPELLHEAAHPHAPVPAHHFEDGHLALRSEHHSHSFEPTLSKVNKFQHTVG